MKLCGSLFRLPIILIALPKNWRTENDFLLEKFFRKSFPRKYPDLIGLHLKDLNLPIIDDTVTSYAIQIANGEQEAWSNIARVGDKVWEIKLYTLIQMAGQPPGKCVLELNDISRKVELEEKILQAEKLSSLSFLSAGIAHEINNPLTGIIGYAEYLLSEDEPLTESQKEGLKRIMLCAERIEKEINDLCEIKIKIAEEVDIENIFPDDEL